MLSYLILHTTDVSDHPEDTQHAKTNPETHVDNEAQHLGILVEVLDHISGGRLQHGSHAQYSHSNDYCDLNVIGVIESVADLAQLVVQDHQLLELAVDLIHTGDIEDMEPVVFVAHDGTDSLRRIFTERNTRVMSTYSFMHVKTPKLFVTVQSNNIPRIFGEFRTVKGDAHHPRHLDIHFFVFN